ncbi:hypothetical protein V8G61_03635 [Gaetbulibacter sp. M240]|uniref:hypothetical protein n=1 Tax=Gaetbulibacter sp. M240 TaxID=3126511 RepID=UPI00374FB4EE
MKKSIYLIPFIFIIFTCSKSDPVTNTTSQTFLEKYAGTVWTTSDDDVTTYIRFVNNMNHPIEYWIDANECFYYLLEEFFENDAITQNLNDTIEFTYTENDGDIVYVDIITVTVSGNTMVAAYEYYEDDTLYESGSIIFIKSSEKVDDFILCDD